VQELVNLEIILSFIPHHTILIPLLNSFVVLAVAVAVALVLPGLVMLVVDLAEVDLHRGVLMRDLLQVLLIQITLKLLDMLVDLVPEIHQLQLVVEVVPVALVVMVNQVLLHHPLLLLVMVVLVFKFLLLDHPQIHNR
jgi:hypothetical protein